MFAHSFLTNRVAAVVAAALAVGFTVTNLTGVDAAGDEPLSYVATSPCRLVDTRPAAATNVGPRDTPLGATETFAITARGAQGQCSPDQLPTDAQALALNVTALRATDITFLTIWPDGDLPNASSLNPAPGQPPVPNAVTTPLSDTGTFNVYNNAGTVHLIIDVVGHYTDHDHDDRYYTETEIDAALSTKADTAEVYTQSDIDAGFYARGQSDARYTTKADSQQSRTAFDARLRAVEAGGSTQGRTIFVGGDQTPGQNGTALVNAVASAAAQSPTAESPWIVTLDAGTFVTSELTLPAHVHLHGSGSSVSVISGRIVATGETTIRSLTIDNPGVTTFRSVTTSATLILEEVEIIGDSALAVDDGADVTVRDSILTTGDGPSLTMVGATANAQVLIERTSITNAAAAIIALELDGGSLTLRDVTGTFAGSAVAADTVLIDDSHLTFDGQLGVTNAGSMEVIDSYVERSPATTFRVISVVGVGSELRVLNSSVIGGGGGGDDAVGGDSESCTGVAADAGWFDTTCP